jgi:signal-transduction protein with cAMP-binding, CBS, and nucleotidyltransferase domain
MPKRVLPNNANKDFIKNIFLFSGLTDAEKETLCADGVLYSYLKKEILYRQTDPVTHFYVICKGAVHLFQEAADGSLVTEHLRVAGDTINSTPAFLPGSKVHHVNAVAATDSLILDFPISWLKNAVQNYSVVALNLLCSLSQRAYNMELEARNQSRMSSQQLLACFLTRTCVIEGHDQRGFTLPYSKSIVASRLRMMQETLSRTIPKLEECGISVENKHVKIYDLPKLEQNLCSHCPGAQKCYARSTLQKDAGNIKELKAA